MKIFIEDLNAKADGGREVHLKSLDQIRFESGEDKYTVGFNLNGELLVTKTNTFNSPLKLQPVASNRIVVL